LYSQFCKEVLSLHDDQIVFSESSFFVDATGSSAALTASMASALGEAMNAIEKSGPMTQNGVAPKAGSVVWELVPFKKTTELHMLESQMRGRISVMSETQTLTEAHAFGGMLHRHVKSIT